MQNIEKISNIIKYNKFLEFLKADNDLNKFSSKYFKNLKYDLSIYKATFENTLQQYFLHVGTINNIHFYIECYYVDDDVVLYKNIVKIENLRKYKDYYVAKMYKLYELDNENNFNILLNHKIKLTKTKYNDIENKNFKIANEY